MTSNRNLTHHCLRLCVLQRKECFGWFHLGGLCSLWTMKALASLFSLSCYMDWASFLGYWHFTQRWKELNFKADCHFRGELWASGSLGVSDYRYFYLDSSKCGLLWHKEGLLYNPAQFWQLVVFPASPSSLQDSQTSVCERFSHGDAWALLPAVVSTGCGQGFCI